MEAFKNYEAWFITGSQHLYGEEALIQVQEDAKKIVSHLNEEAKLPVKINLKPVLTDSASILQICQEANSNKNCIGLIAWMHTFSPAKMWIDGMKNLMKPFMHLHTQFNKEIPWNEIDMDFMNLNQSAHGGREFGFMASRMQIERKVVVGHWKNDEVKNKLNIWLRSALALADSKSMKIARFGDNMRNVAVTEGNKVSAQIQFGYEVHGYGVGDLVQYINQVGDHDISRLIDEYKNIYELDEKILKDPNFRHSLTESAKIETGMRNFLNDGNFKAFTTTFEDLHHMDQLPGLAVQRLMADGYGFGAEGDWKTAALVRSMKVMAHGNKGGTSFMEDYTYHLSPEGDRVLGAHMLEVCPSIASKKPGLEIHPLGIGGKNDPARLTFGVNPGKALNASLMDLGNRFRLLVNTVDVVECPQLPKLPVARVLWKPNPTLNTSAEAWILAGGAHHTGFSMAITPEYLENFAEMTGIEYLLIDNNTTISDFKNQLRWNEMYYSFCKR